MPADAPNLVTPPVLLLRLRSGNNRALSGVEAQLLPDKSPPQAAWVALKIRGPKGLKGLGGVMK